MSTDMSSVDYPSGFSIWGECIRQSMYAVETEPVINVYHGDMVIGGGAMLQTAHGAMTIIVDDAVPDGVAATEQVLGVVTAVFDKDMNPVKYIAATEAGDSTVAGYIMVADDPHQRYIIQEDGTTAAIDLADAGMTVDVVSVALCAGTAASGISTQEIASDTVDNTAAHDLLLHFPHPDDTVANDTNCHARWIVSINTSFYGTFHDGN